MKWYGALHRNLRAFDVLRTRKSTKHVKTWAKTKNYLTLFGPYEDKRDLAKVLRNMRLPIAQERDIDLKANPVQMPRHVSTEGAVEIYDQIHAIEAKKGTHSLWPRENFRHDFTKKGTKIFGLRDGSILITGRQKLWKYFQYPEDVSSYG